MRIYAPVDNVNGVYASVLFVNSVGETDNPALIKWFKSRGYRVEDQRVERVATVTLDDRSVLDRVVEDVGDTSQPDFDSMTPNELRDWMRENGYGSQIKNIRNKDKLLEIIRK